MVEGKISTLTPTHCSNFHSCLTFLIIIAWNTTVVSKQKINWKNFVASFLPLCEVVIIQLILK